MASLPAASCWRGSRRLPTRPLRQGRSCACVGSRKPFVLEPVDTELLLVALMPDLDARFELLYAYLHDDVTRRRASIGLALELAAPRLAPAEARHRLTGTAPLLVGRARRSGGRGQAVPVPSACVCPIESRCTCSGTITPTPPSRRSSPSRTPAEPAIRKPSPGRSLAGANLVHVREPGGAAGRSLAAAALARAGLAVLALDLAPLSPGDDAGALVRVRAARGAAPQRWARCGPVDRLAELDRAALRALADARWTIVLTGRARGTRRGRGPSR